MYLNIVLASHPQPEGGRSSEMFFCLYRVATDFKECASFYFYTTVKII
jgi:hypothetical protein